MKAKQIENGKATVAVKADVAAKTTAKESRVSLNARGRETLQALGCGVNTFGSFIGRANVLRSEVDFVNANADEIREKIVNRKSKTVWHLTKGEIGVHGGQCELFENVKVGERIVNVYRREDGTLYTDKVTTGFAHMTDDELLAVAQKREKFAIVRIDTRADGGGWDEGEEMLGTIIGSLDKRKQVLVYRSADGLSVENLTTHACATHELRQANIVSVLKGDEMEKVQRALYEGIEGEKRKSATRNATREARAALAAKRKAEALTA